MSCKSCTPGKRKSAKAPEPEPEEIHLCPDCGNEVTDSTDWHCFARCASCNDKILKSVKTKKVKISEKLWRKWEHMYSADLLTPYEGKVGSARGLFQYEGRWFVTVGAWSHYQENGTFEAELEGRPVVAASTWTGKKLVGDQLIADHGSGGPHYYNYLLFRWNKQEWVIMPELVIFCIDKKKPATPEPVQDKLF